MGSPCTSRHFETLCVFNMDGNHKGSQASAHVVLNSTTTRVHFFNRHRGAFSTIRHNCIRDLTSQLLTEVWPSVEVRFLRNERQGAFFDVRVFNPFAPSHASQTIQSTYWKNEKEKKRQYEKRIIDIEPGSFTPLVMSVTGRLKLGPSAGVSYRRLTRMISQKHLTPYCEINEDNLVQAFLFTCRHPHWHDRQWGPLVNSIQFCFQWQMHFELNMYPHGMHVCNYVC